MEETTFPFASSYLVDIVGQILYRHLGWQGHHVVLWPHGDYKFDLVYACGTTWSYIVAHYTEYVHNNEAWNKVP